MTIEFDVRDLLLSDSTIGRLVGARIYPVQLPQSPTYPAISYAAVSLTVLRDLSGPTGREQLRISISVWSAHYVEAKTIAAAIKALLNGFKGMLGGSNVGDLRLENVIDFTEPEARVYRVMHDYIISYKEA